MHGWKLGYSLPVQWAVDQGVADILAITTSFAGLKQKQSLPNFLGEKYFKNHLGLTNIFSKQHVKFNESTDFILNPPSRIKIQ